MISGHDAIQTEQLFLKHLGPKDAFVNADVAGARTCFVRNPSGQPHSLPQPLSQESSKRANFPLSSWHRFPRWTCFVCFPSPSFLAFLGPSGGEVPPATLREAGTLALCHSSAWDKQMVISAWWVPIAQVTRGGWSSSEMGGGRGGPGGGGGSANCGGTRVRSRRTFGERLGRRKQCRVAMGRPKKNQGMSGMLLTR